MTKQKLNLLVGSIGAFIGIFVFIAYIPQIYANLQGSAKRNRFNHYLLQFPA